MNYEKINWCVLQHKNTNHYYDKYLPYEFHLRMVAQVYKDFEHILPKDNYWDDPFDKGGRDDESVTWAEVIEPACWGHDLIEDTRCSYNDVKSYLGTFSADIIYACTNEKGKNREERGNDKYYEGIRNTKGAAFVKLCDRIANIQYSKLTKSRMFEMYKKENEKFVSSLNRDEYPTMFDYIESLFLEK